MSIGVFQGKAGAGTPAGAVESGRARETGDGVGEVVPRCGRRSRRRTEDADRPAAAAAGPAPRTGESSDSRQGDRRLCGGRRQSTFPGIAEARRAEGRSRESTCIRYIDSNIVVPTALLVLLIQAHM